MWLIFLSASINSFLFFVFYNLMSDGRPALKILKSAFEKPKLVNCLYCKQSRGKSKIDLALPQSSFKTPPLASTRTCCQPKETMPCGSKSCPRAQCHSTLSLSCVLWGWWRKKPCLLPPTRTTAPARSKRR